MPWQFTGEVTGAIFWMWVTGLFGMMLKFVECTLSMKYRHFNKDGSVSGGPMYYMEYGLKKQLGKFAKILAVIFAIATMVCALGTGNMAQSNSISDVLVTNYNIPVWSTGLLLMVLVLLVIVGGNQTDCRGNSPLSAFYGNHLFY
ncbi:MAG: alanine:cation symporter family protein [Bacteroidales bacterium]|nr:alanine:cation symporter family protein [Bacteroidales bacterium]